MSDKKSDTNFDHLYLVMEMEAKDLQTILRSMDSTELTEDHIVTIMYNFLCGL